MFTEYGKVIVLNLLEKGNTVFFIQKIDEDYIFFSMEYRVY